MRCSTLSAMLIWLAVLLGVAPAAFADVTGVYLVEDSTSLEVFQLVEQADGTLAGQLESYWLEPGGDVSSASYALSGSVRGVDLVIKTDPGLNTLFTSATFAGRVRSGALELTWEGGSGTYGLSDLRARGHALETLTARGAAASWQIAIEGNDVKFLRARSDFETLNARAPQLKADLGGARTAWQQKSDTGRRLERQLAAVRAGRDDWEAAHALEMEIHDLDMDMFQMGIEVDTLYFELDGAAAEIARQLGEVSDFCAAHSGRLEGSATCSEITALRPKVTATFASIQSEFDTWRDVTEQP